MCYEGTALYHSRSNCPFFFTSVDAAVVHDPVRPPPNPLLPLNFPMNLPSFPASHVPVALRWTSGTLGTICPSPLPGLRQAWVELDPSRAVTHQILVQLMCLLQLSGAGQTVIMQNIINN